MNNTIKYLKLFINFLKINLKEIAVYDKDFIFGIISILIKNIINIILFSIPFSFIDNINNWNFYELMFFYGFSYSSYALWHCFFINTITIPHYIQTGKMDVILLKPVPAILYIMMDGFDEDGWGDLIFGISVLIYSIIHLKLLTLKIFLLPIFLISSCLIYAGISLLFSIISFFTVGNSDFTDLTMELQTFSKYPLSIYRKVFKILFIFIFPIAFSSYYPSLYYIRDNKYSLLTPAVCCIFFFSVCAIWNKCLKFYKSSGH